jgi:hypothetical protein
MDSSFSSLFDALRQMEQRLGAVIDGRQEQSAVRYTGGGGTVFGREPCTDEGSTFPIRCRSMTSSMTAPSSTRSSSSTPSSPLRPTPTTTSTTYTDDLGGEPVFDNYIDNLGGEPVFDTKLVLDRVDVELAVFHQRSDDLVATHQCGLRRQPPLRRGARQ